MNKPNYYAILTAEVRYSKTLSSSQKLFYAELTALSEKSGKCWASNSYFAKLFDVSTSTITHWVSALKEQGFIDVFYETEGQQVTKRIIKICPLKQTEGGQDIDQGGQETTRGVVKKSQEGWSKNLKENTTSKSNTTRKQQSARAPARGETSEKQPGRLQASSEEGKVVAPAEEFEDLPSSVEEESIIKRIDAADSTSQLVGIYREYRQKMGVWDNNFTQEAQQHHFSKLGLRRGRLALKHTITNGWKKLVDPDRSEEAEAAAIPFDPTGRPNASAYKII